MKCIKCKSKNISGLTIFSNNNEQVQACLDCNSVWYPFKSDIIGKISNHKKWKIPRVYKLGKYSHSYKPNLIQHKEKKIKCICGCGEVIDKYDFKGTQHRFKVGHHYNWLHNHVKGKPQPLRTKDQDLTCDSERLRRARWYLKYRDHRDITKEKCIVYDRQICLGSTHTFFIDGNYTNFSPDNLGVMCKGHRQLMAINHLDLQDLKQLKAHFYNTPRSRTHKRRWMIPGKNYHK